jgi:hypothetical protein
MDAGLAILIFLALGALIILVLIGSNGSGNDSEPEAPPPAADEHDPPGDEWDRAQALYQLVDESFSTDELRELCFEMRIDVDSLPGESKTARARELALYCLRHDRLDDLSRHFVAKRPHLAGRLKG